MEERPTAVVVAAVVAAAVDVEAAAAYDVEENCSFDVAGILQESDEADSSFGEDVALGTAVAVVACAAAVGEVARQILAAAGWWRTAEGR